MSEEKGNYAVAVIDPAAVMPVLNIAVARQRRNDMVEFVREIMREGEDYGVIPGTNDKKTLLKAGAEKLTTFFGLSKRFAIIEKIEDWDRPLFYYLYRCSLYKGELLIAEADGSCSSRESKYRYRKSERKCPKCGQTTIIKGLDKYGGGWLCYAKKGGCAAKFKDGDQIIESQVVNRIENPDAADQANTILKMAQKRALVAATLLAVNASEFFTQDMEDFVDGEIVAESPQSTGEPPAQQPLANGNAETAPMTIENVSNVGQFYKYVMEKIPRYRDGSMHINQALKAEGIDIKTFSAYKVLEWFTKLNDRANVKANEQIVKEEMAATAQKMTHKA
jgi:hypothetical protein